MSFRLQPYVLRLQVQLAHAAQQLLTRGGVERKAHAGGTDHQTVATCSTQGGVCIATQGAAVNTATDDPAVQALHATTRWQDCWIP